jgi:hypothetical protein
MANCKAADRNTCRVHGAGGMYQHLQTVANEAIKTKDFETYYEARARMDEMGDNSKPAIKFFERGGVPTLAERIGNKMDAFADRIMEARDNINEKIIEAEPSKDTVGGKLVNFADRIMETRDNINEKVVEALEKSDEQGSNKKAGNKVFESVDRITETRDKINEAVSGGVNMITDRHEAPIPSEIGGSTIAWSDMNPFKNGKLR